MPISMQTFTPPILAASVIIKKKESKKFNKYSFHSHIQGQLNLSEPKVKWLKCKSHQTWEISDWHLPFPSMSQETGVKMGPYINISA